MKQHRISVLFSYYYFLLSLSANEYGNCKNCGRDDRGAGDDCAAAGFLCGLFGLGFNCGSLCSLGLSSLGGSIGLGSSGGCGSLSFGRRGGSGSFGSSGSLGGLGIYDLAEGKSLNNVAIADGYNVARVVGVEEETENVSHKELDLSFKTLVNEEVLAGVILDIDSGGVVHTINLKRVFLNGRSVGGGVDGVADGGVLNVIVAGEGLTLVHKLDLVGISVCAVNRVGVNTYGVVAGTGNGVVDGVTGSFIEGKGLNEAAPIGSSLVIGGLNCDGVGVGGVNVDLGGTGKKTGLINACFAVEVGNEHNGTVGLKVENAVIRSAYRGKGKNCCNDKEERECDRNDFFHNISPFY